MRFLLSADDRAVVHQADAIRRRARQEAKLLRPKPVRPTAPGQRDPREHDADYMRWIHAEGLPCVICEIEGPAPFKGGNPIEFAHQKLPIAAKGWAGAGKGSRGHDRRGVPLCRWHHQLAPNACDKAQRKCWDRVGLGDDIADFCDALYAAFKAVAPGLPVIRSWVAVARERLAADSSRPRPPPPERVGGES